MCDFILHIGRHKSGTTSIQHFLRKNNDYLKQQGFLYPEYYCKEAAHHGLTRLLKSGDDSEITKVLDIMKTEARQANCSNIILSTETFQQFHQPDYLLKFFPVENTSVISYIRNPIDYFISTYQQKVQASKLSVSITQYEKLFKLSLVNYINTWKSTYGSKLYLRFFSRDHLCKSDVVEDFCALIKINTGNLEKINYKNISITGNLLLYKLILNRVLVKCNMQDKRLHNELENIAKERREFIGKLPVNEQLLHTLRERFHRDILAIDHEFNVNLISKQYDQKSDLFDFEKLYSDFNFIHKRLTDIGLIDIPLNTIFNAMNKFFIELY